MNAKAIKISNKRWTRQHTNKKMYVIHWTATDVEQMNNHFKKAGREVSYHYAVKEGNVYQYVDTRFIAHHAGNWETNKKSVGVALDGGYGDNPKPSDKTHDTTAELIARDAYQRGIKKLVLNDNVYGHGHEDVGGGSTQCPGSTDVDYIINKANEFIMSYENQDNKKEDKSIEEYMQDVAYAYFNVFNAPPTYRYTKFEAKKLRDGEVKMGKLIDLWKDESKDYEKHFANLWEYVKKHNGLRDKYDIKSVKNLYEVVENNYGDIVSHYIKHGIPEGITDNIEKM